MYSTKWQTKWQSYRSGTYAQKYVPKWNAKLQKDKQRRMVSHFPAQGWEIGHHRPIEIQAENPHDSAIRREQSRVTFVRTPAISAMSARNIYKCKRTAKYMKMRTDDYALGRRKNMEKRSDFVEAKAPKRSRRNLSTRTTFAECKQGQISRL